MKDRTGLTQCGWSASVPVWASRKEATSVEAVGTAIQSSSQRDRVRVTTARDVGRIRPTGASRRARGSKTIPASTRVTSMSAGGGTWSLRKIRNSIAHAHYIYADSSVQCDLPAEEIGGERRLSPVW